MSVLVCLLLSVRVCVCCLPEIAVVTGFLGMLCVLPQCGDGNTFQWILFGRRSLRQSNLSIRPANDADVRIAHTLGLQKHFSHFSL